MRSRDGNSYLILRLLSLISLCSLAINAEELLISYDYTTKNHTIYSQTLNISKAMTKCSGTDDKTLMLDTNGSKNIKEVLENNQDEFFTFTQTLPIEIISNDTTINLQNSSSTTIRLKTTCFKVDFNDNIATITTLK